MQTGHRGPGRPAKGGHRHSVRFLHEDVYSKAQQAWKELRFESFSDYVDFTFALAHGKWAELGFDSPEAGASYLAALAAGSVVTPPHLRGGDQPELPLSEDVAA